MATIYSLKPGFQKLLRPLVKRLEWMGVSPNQITIAALMLSIGAGTFVAHTRSSRALLLLPPVLFLRMALNAMDGMLAREGNQQSALGAILNELGDVVSDIALYLPLALLPGFAPQSVVAIVILSVLTEMTGVMGPGIGASRRYDGPLGKSDRAFLFGLIALLLGAGLPIAPAVPLTLFTIMALLAITITNRMGKMLQEVARRGVVR
ncbi:MAG TPA: CDP-alcohol phosphatidyltransferase family protein [Terracidiphilus sp.]|nr:CDP-alcohol phosphatidyltransferase family protein [Terracidiphilus sp.]